MDIYFYGRMVVVSDDAIHGIRRLQAIWRGVKVRRHMQNLRQVYLDTAAEVEERSIGDTEVLHWIPDKPIWSLSTKYEHWEESIHPLLTDANERNTQSDQKVNAEKDEGSAVLYKDHVEQVPGWRADSRIPPKCLVHDGPIIHSNKATLQTDCDSSCLFDGRQPGSDMQTVIGETDKSHEANNDLDEKDKSVDLSKNISKKCLEEVLPETESELIEHRRQLAMELFWIHQAIQSRKQYLVLKRKMDGVAPGEV